MYQQLQNISREKVYRLKVFWLNSGHRPSQGASRPLSPEFVECLVILCFERRYPKQNTAARLKSKVLGWLPQ